MRSAETVLNIIRNRGQRGLPLEDLYRQLYNPALYLRAYAKLYPNKGSMTPGVTAETVDGMSRGKIDAIITALRCERYRWTPVRRTYIQKKNGKLRPLGLPSWSDKLLQEVMRSLLEAYYEPQFSPCSHGFRPRRGCHTALEEIGRRWKGMKWFIEGDICAFFDSIGKHVLLKIMQEHIHDNRFIRLVKHLLDAGYMEARSFHPTYSGVPQGGVISPTLSNIVLDRLDKYVERALIPTYTRGLRRKTNRPYVALTVAASEARKAGDRETARQLSKQAQALPSRAPSDSDFRRLWYCRYCDDFLLGFIGTKAEAQEIKHRLATFLRDELALELSAEKTLITHARDDVAHVLGYAVHTLHADDKHDHRGQRCINGAIGLRIPANVIHAHCAKYLRDGKPMPRMQRVNDSAYSIVAQYQTEYRGVVQYYRMAYNLHQLQKLKWVMEQSLVRTLAKKFNASRGKIYQRFKALHRNAHGTYKVLEVRVERGPSKKPLVAHFGGVPLRWNRWVTINAKQTAPIWSGRSEVVERLLAEKCELCGATEKIEVHHIRKLADLEHEGRSHRPRWVRIMAARRRKTLVVCQDCHHDIQYGRYDGPALSSKSHRRAT
ncbi:MAG TPA: reverse transcriptase domain-containing protein [Candidatus Tectomicrobia bacterium]|jgi:group II intron reverse transcriptase/maturase